MVQNSKQRRVLTALALFSGIMGGFVTGAVAQTEKPVSTPSPHLMVFEQARQLGDVNTAIMSLHQLLIADKEKYASYTDTLALLYFDARNYAVCNTLCTLLLAKKPDKTVLMELKAASLRQLGQAVESADLYGQLFTKTKNRMVGVELMQLQLGLKRLNECLQTTDRVISRLVVMVTMS
ncbi:tetratricopeptide repeat protein [Spirosoma utsteinense]|uniref:Zn-dependent protease n=1 Tax=Spirosoma utsteinense TaxID=2585773 RepID=A0ABR6WFG8_9BACT|nr:hypothetical protein [Spirosoma utsteinense]MBC3795277.1 putative Zn-dependent protease [Spirosoma utsteinense]